MAYNPNIPNASDYQDESQGQLKQNFQQLDTSFGIDHVEFSQSNGTTGFHKKSTYEKQSVDPSTSADQICVYAKELSSVVRLFLREPTNGTIQQFSGPVVKTLTAGETTLLGGIQIKFGVAPGSNSGTASTFAGLGLSNFTTACIAVIGTTQIVSNANDFIVQVRAKSTTGFTLRVSDAGGSANVYFLAIGY